MREFFLGLSVIAAIILVNAAIVVVFITVIVFTLKALGVLS